MLKRRYSHPNVLDINFGAYYLIHEGRSRIWPPSSELRRRQVSSDEGGVSIHETGGTLESLQESTNKILSPDKNPRHVSSKESCQTIHRSTRESDNDSTTYQESTSDMSTYSGNIAPSYVEQKPEMEGKQAKSQSIANIQTKEARSKRKSSSDDTPNWPAYDTPQHSSKRIKSNSEDIPIKNEPLDEELLDRLQKLRNDTDTTMNETGSPLVCHAPTPLVIVPQWVSTLISPQSDPSVQTACDIPGDNPFLTVKEKREEEVQIWLSLANAINKARSVLRGDDRELFEQLITVPATSTEAEKLIQRWKDGKLATFGRPGEMASKPFNWKERSEQATSPRERDSTYFSMEGYPGCF